MAKLMTIRQALKAIREHGGYGNGQGYFAVYQLADGRRVWAGPQSAPSDPSWWLPGTTRVVVYRPDGSVQYARNL